MRQADHVSNATLAAGTPRAMRFGGYVVPVVPYETVAYFMRMKWLTALWVLELATIISGGHARIRWRIFVALLLGLVGLVGPPNDAAAQARREVTGSPSCSSCRVELLQIATVGDATGPGMVHQQGLLARDDLGVVYVSSNSDPGTIRLFDHAGRFLRKIGRPGSGPGEYRGRPDVKFLGQSRLLVVDGAARRATILDSTDRVLSTRTLPLRVTQTIAFDDSRLVVTGDDRSAARIGIPLHVLDQNGAVTRSFGAEDQRVDLTTGFSRFRIIGKSDRPGAIWSARWNEYSMERWDTAGRMDTALRRNVDWFQPWVEAKGYIGVERQPSMIRALYERGDSLWVFVQVDDANWKPNPPVPVPSIKDATYTPDSFREKLFDTIVEVIHVPTGRLILSQRISQELIGVAPDGYAFSYREDDQGNPQYVVWRLALRVNK